MPRRKHNGGPSAEKFAYIPKSVLTHPSLATAPHACLRMLHALACGITKDRNGTMMASESYCKDFGLTSHGTVQRSLDTLKNRGLIVCTRRVQRMRRVAAQWAVTWWPIYYRDGEPCPPEPASRAYEKWSPITPTKRVIGKVAAGVSSPPLRADITPTTRVNESIHHPYLPRFSAADHPHYEGNSRLCGGTHPFPQGAETPVSAAHVQGPIGGREKIEKLMRLQSHLPNADIARICHEPIELVAEVRRSLETP